MNWKTFRMELNASFWTRLTTQQVNPPFTALSLPGRCGRRTAAPEPSAPDYRWLCDLSLLRDELTRDASQLAEKARRTMFDFAFGRSGQWYENTPFYPSTPRGWHAEWIQTYWDPALVTPGGLLLNSVKAGASEQVKHGLIANFGGGASLAGDFFSGTFGKSTGPSFDPPVDLRALYVHERMIEWIIGQGEHHRGASPCASYSLW